MALGPALRSVVLLAITLPACDLLQSDGSGGSGGAGGAAATGGGGSGGGTPSCEAQSLDCAACRQCAAAGLCADVVNACIDDGACSAIDQCVALCGDGSACLDMCQQQNPAGMAAYDAARQCLDCTACPAKCAGATACPG